MALDLNSIFDDDRPATAVRAERRQLGAVRRGYLLPTGLPEAWREYYEERAAIREFHGGQAREHAEAEALAETVERMRAAGQLPGISTCPNGKHVV